MSKIPFKATILSALLLTGTTPAASAATGAVALGAKAGTTGVGGEITYDLAPGVNLRSGYNSMTYAGDAGRGGIDYDYRLKLSSVPILLDVHPIPMFGLRLTAGAMLNNNRITAVSKASSGYDVGGTTYTPDQVGTISGKADFNTLSPYAGIGWNGPLFIGLPLAITFDAGILFQGEPNVSLQASGPIAGDGKFMADLAEEEAQIKDKIDSLKYYPVVSIGVAFKF